MIIELGSTAYAVMLTCETIWFDTLEPMESLPSSSFAQSKCKDRQRKVFQGYRTTNRNDGKLPSGHWAKAATKIGRIINSSKT
jgi:hypothetical protein